MAGSVMELLDATVTNIAGPTMRADLGGTGSTIQWFAAAYTLAMTAGLLTGGRLGDIYGRRQMFVIGAAGFTVGSLLCSIAQTPEMLIGARIIQGLFGAAMLPQGIGLIRQMFPPKEMQSAFALFGPVMGLSAIGGPILAGWLVGADLFGSGWRMIFLINLPLGLAAVVSAMLLLPDSRVSRGLTFDVPGVVLASAGALLLVYPLVQGREYGWPTWLFVMMAASAAVFAGFASHESRRGRNGRDPLVVSSLFRKRAFAGGLLTGLVLFGCMAGFLLVLSLYTQLGLGYSAIKAGLTSAPFAIGMMLGMGGLQPLQRFGRKVLNAGAVVMAAGVLGVLVTIHNAGDGLSPWQLAPALAVTGVGGALLMGPYFEFVLASVEPHETGSAAGTLTAVQQLGGALGVALLGTIFFATGSGPAAPRGSFVASTDAQAAEQFTGAMQNVLWAAAGMLAFAFVVAFLLPRRSPQTAHQSS
jgi:EmrB/QacA subfamily drug resistance transporter